MDSAYSKFRNRYRELTYIGKGTIGKVHRIYDIICGRDKAEKIIKLPMKPNERNKIIKQVESLLNLCHPNLVMAHEYLIEHRQDEVNKLIKMEYLHLVMQYVDGKQLKTLLGKIQINNIIKIYRQIKSILIFLKKKRVLHRELSLDNILVDEQFNVKMMDFIFISELKNDLYNSPGSKTIKQQYLAPQAFQHTCTNKQDLWTLGIIILEIYFGSHMKKLYSHKPGQDPLFPSDFYKKHQLPEQIKKIVSSLLERDYRKRKYCQPNEEIEQEEKVIELSFVNTKERLFENMKQLRLNNHEISDQGAIEISEKLKNLVLLDLTINHIGPEGATAISKNLTNLMTLSLSNNNLGTQGAIQIAKNLKNLTYLGLSNNKIQTIGVIEIARHLKNLNELYLMNNNIGIEGTHQITKYLKNLTALYLSDNNVRSEGADLISKNLKNLVKLGLSNNDLGTQGIIYIAKNLKNLTWLDVRNNKIKSQGAIEISTHLQNLTILHIGINNIQTQGAISIGKNLLKLIELDMSNNKIETAGAIELSHLKNLNWLDLSDNNIGFSGITYIIKQLKNLNVLWIQNNKIKQNERLKIQQMMKQKILLV